MLPGLDYPGAGDEAAEQAYLQRAIRVLGWGYIIERLLEMALVRQVVVPSPAAGAEWVAIVPAGVEWELLAVHARFLASAAVANRVPRIQVRDQDQTTIVDYTQSRTWTATANVPYTFSAGHGASVSNVAQNDPLPNPPYVVPATWRIQSVTSGLDASDQYSEIILTVREWASGRIARAMRYLTTDLESAGGFL